MCDIADIIGDGNLDRSSGASLETKDTLLCVEVLAIYFGQPQTKHLQLGQVNVILYTSIMGMQMIDFNFLALSMSCSEP